MINLKPNQKKIIKKLMGPVKRTLEQNGIKVYEVPNMISSQGIFWSDYPWDFVKEKHYSGSKSNLWLNESMIIIDLKLNYDQTLYLGDNNSLNLQHNIVTREDRQNVDRIFTKMMENNYQWNKSDRMTINIKL